jgi:class 3 adenylate cyclase
MSDSTIIPVSCFMFCITKESEIFFVLHFIDFRKYQQQEDKLKTVEQQVEDLLYRILPRTMAKNLISKRNEESTQMISEIKVATILFISIDHFNEWCEDHTSEEIIYLLGIVFGTFDTIISKYKTLCHIKEIGGTYMVGGGLFPEERSENNPELDAIDFALNCYESISKRPKILGFAINLKIGINTDGPIIAGILGKDTPLFDIWGDAVNVSARLYATCRLNHIQISKSCYNILRSKGCNYSFVQTPNVMLKGKGLTTTYVLKADFKPKLQIKSYSSMSSLPLISNHLSPV